MVSWQRPFSLSLPLSRKLIINNVTSNKRISRTEARSPSPIERRGSRRATVISCTAMPYACRPLPASWPSPSRAPSMDRLAARVIRPIVFSDRQRSSWYLIHPRGYSWEASTEKACPLGRWEVRNSPTYFPCLAVRARESWSVMLSADSCLSAAASAGGITLVFLRVYSKPLLALVYFVPLTPDELSQTSCRGYPSQTRPAVMHRPQNGTCLSHCGKDGGGRVRRDVLEYK